MIPDGMSADDEIRKEAEALVIGHGYDKQPEYRNFILQDRTVKSLVEEAYWGIKHGLALRDKQLRELVEKLKGIEDESENWPITDFSNGQVSARVAIRQALEAILGGGE